MSVQVLRNEYVVDIPVRVLATPSPTGSRSRCLPARRCADRLVDGPPAGGHAGPRCASGGGGGEVEGTTPNPAAAGDVAGLSPSPGAALARARGQRAAQGRTIPGQPRGGPRAIHPPAGRAFPSSATVSYWKVRYGEPSPSSQGSSLAATSAPVLPSR